ncbi:hypothetical protein AGLY_010170 [Aphis glycines]|uniref:Uncharacterized protein n=1 Tax=Aphis glycines TaxID=307491 RepID=A0A6G0TG43_APHGL|nr:hypothetical protein AGLY_010170 [Aphis glycines]
MSLGLGMAKLSWPLSAAVAFAADGDTVVAAAAAVVAVTKDVPAAAIIAVIVVMMRMVFVLAVRVATRLTVVDDIVVVVVMGVVMEVIVVGNGPEQTVATGGHFFGRRVPERQALLDFGRGRSAQIARRRRRRLGPLFVQNLGGHPLTGSVSVRGRVVTNALYAAQRFGLWPAGRRGRPRRRVLFLLAAARAVAAARLPLLRRVPANDLRPASAATAFGVVVLVVFGPTGGRIVTLFAPRPQTPLQTALLPTRLVRVHVVGRRRFLRDDDVVVAFVVVVVFVVAVAVVIVIVVVDDGFHVAVVLVFFFFFLPLLFCCDQRYNLCSFSRYCFVKKNIKLMNLLMVYIKNILIIEYLMCILGITQLPISAAVRYHSNGKK